MSELDQVVRAVASARKYRALCQDTVRRVAERELATVPAGDVKAAIKATKRRLHQAVGAFEHEIDYQAVYRQLESAYRSGSEAGIRASCRQGLALHQSTRERLPILDRFYPAMWAVTGKPSSVLDLGCGLNPLALPWMGLAEGARYVALDVDHERVEFLQRYLALAGREPLAHCQDLLAPWPAKPDQGRPWPPAERYTADVALLLKMSPTLERQEPGATARLIELLEVASVVISFAVKSLGGRDKGMLEHYQEQFLELATAHRWSVHRQVFETELVFVVRRSMRQRP